ncbi:hypothetical protein CTRI78_v000335 [Colletotrichum trifolii]|uniref:Reticulon-like protein n=1 Tax=Colletotrichum trifolii TaxID=5466 RepID=A0A4V3HXQ3_COLTR|nr:hypothetical protein CTRI78_v000335 [Colletotrichum trifolii]
MSSENQVLPAYSGSASQPSQETAQNISAIRSVFNDNDEGKHHEAPTSGGPLRQVLAHSDSLYKYINWEDPARTLGAYVGAMSVLFGAHYLPLTRLAVKAGLTTLGAITVTEFVTRSLSAQPLSARLRPRQYRTVPEPTLNATLQDVHDFVQYAVVQLQKTVYGENLSLTIGAFAALTALYWIVPQLSAFGLAVVALHAVFIAPVLTSPAGRQATREVGQRTQELVNATAERSKELAQDGQVKVTQLAGAAADKSKELSQNGQAGAANLVNATVDKSKKLTQNTQAQAGNLANATADKGRELSQNTQAQAGNLTGATGTNPFTQVSGLANSALGNVRQYVGGSSPGQPGGVENSGGSTNDSAGQMYQASNNENTQVDSLNDNHNDHRNSESLDRTSPPHGEAKAVPSTGSGAEYTPAAAQTTASREYHDQPRQPVKVNVEGL